MPVSVFAISGREKRRARKVIVNVLIDVIRIFFALDVLAWRRGIDACRST